LLQAWKMIENEELVPLADQPEDRGGAGGPEGPGSGFAGPKLQPLWSTAHGIDAELPPPSPVAPSVGEAILRQNIRAGRSIVVDQARPGSRQALASVWNRTVRSVANKDLDDMGVDELSAVLVALKAQPLFRGRW